MTKKFHKFYLDKQPMVEQPGEARQADIQEFLREYDAKLVQHILASHGNYYRNMTFIDCYYFERVSKVEEKRG